MIRINIFIFLLLFLISSLEAKVQNVELIADDVNRTGDLTEARGNVLVYSQDYLLSAQKAIYNKKDDVLELFGNVNAIRSDKKISRAEYVKINLKDKSQFAKVNFLMDQNAEVWMQNNTSCSNKEYYETSTSIVSSCNIQDPDWKIKFSSGYMNKKSKFLHLFNPVFYVGDVPILYLPYFGFPTDKTRRTGLLIPEFGYISDQGFYYKQPIYFAPYKSWDFELDPQIRTRRGAGIFGIFRWVDSPYSYGELKGGSFFNEKRAQKRLDYKDRQNYGAELLYNRSKILTYLFKDPSIKENLWMNLIYLNDLEYFDLKSRSGADDDDSLVTSKINYYITTDENYLGLYTRYYIDTAKLNGGTEFKNRDTVQELPSTQYHKFISPILFPNLLYSFDAKFNNFTRRDGVTARQYEADFPLVFTKPLFDGYANFTFIESIYATQIDYSDNYLYNSGLFYKKDGTSYINNYHKFNLSTDLAKAYTNFYHTFNFGVDYLLPGYQKGYIQKRLFKDYKYLAEKKRGEVKKNLLSKESSNYYYEDNFISNLTKDITKENIGAYFSQFFYNSNGRKIIRQSVKQRFYLDEGEIGNLDHRIDFYPFSNFSFGNRFSYSYKNNSFEKIQTYANYRNSIIGANLIHSYEHYQKTSLSNEYKDNYIIGNLDLNLPKFYTLFGAIEYDINKEYTKMWRVGLTHKRKCWNYSIVYQEDIEPRTVANNSYKKASKEQGVYLFVNFYPFGGVGYDFSSKTNYSK